MNNHAASVLASNATTGILSRSVQGLIARESQREPYLISRNQVNSHLNYWRDESFANAPYISMFNNLGVAQAWASDMQSQMNADGSRGYENIFIAKVEPGRLHETTLSCSEPWWSGSLITRNFPVWQGGGLAVFAAKHLRPYYRTLEISGHQEHEWLAIRNVPADTISIVQDGM
ncbi:hypothetical protein E8E11_010157 [Didymella keratinophila]|nr:hypothetical protein E8E11_010157 [Didymella keratinophila]